MLGSHDPTQRFHLLTLAGDGSVSSIRNPSAVASSAGYRSQLLQHLQAWRVAASGMGVLARSGLGELV
jgi:hypothetical protein